MFIKAEHIKTFNDIEIKIYEFIMKNSLLIPYMTIRELASEIDVSTTSILRFINKVGYSSFTDFKYAYKVSLQNENKLQSKYDFSEVIDCLKKFDSTFYKDKFNDAIEILGNVDNVVFLGIGNSGIVGQYGARRFSSVGKFALAINDPYLRINSFTENSAIIALSVSGETIEIINEINACKKFGCKVISITTTENCTISKLSDVCIPYYINKEGLEYVDLTTQVPAIGIIENLARMCFTK